MVSNTPPVWVNLEYLSAEGFVERAHSLPSPVMRGPAKGCTKWFFYPGFTSATGGLLREPILLQRRAAFDSQAWLAQLGLPLRTQAQRVSLFCYEPVALPQLLRQLAHADVPTDLLVAPGRPHAAVLTALEQRSDSDTAPSSAALQWQQGQSVPHGALTLHPLPHLSQTDFDHLLWSCQLNMVRGEDSLVRALWAGQPLVWHIYPQHDNAHHDKLAAFAHTTAMPDTLQTFHNVWNGVTSGHLPALTSSHLREWQTWASHAQQGLAAQADLTSQLLGFVAQKS
jgi:uncharacterized repeat protein (TIGR03837 family)